MDEATRLDVQRCNDLALAIDAGAFDEFDLEDAEAIRRVVKRVEELEGDRDEAVRIIEATGEAINPVRKLASDAVDDRVRGTAEAAAEATNRWPGNSEPWAFSRELRDSMRREYKLDELDAACRDADRLLTRLAVAKEAAHQQEAPDAT